MIKQLNRSVLGSIILLLIQLLVSCQQLPEQNKMENQLQAGNLLLSDAQIQLANIKVTEINEGSIGPNLVFTGVLKVDEQSAVNITSRSTGRIEKLYFKNTGEYVKKGDSLYQFYSDELVAAEREYFTLQRDNWNFSGRYEPSLVLENKLLFLGMLPSQIAQLRKDGKILFSVTIYSPAEGTIRSVNITENQYVNGGEVLFELADDQKLWVEAEVYPDDLASLKEGLPTSVTIPIAGSKTLKSHINFINPSFEKGTNVTSMRCVIDNPDKNLYPGMLALISVQTKKDSGIVIPASAVILDKERSRVWIQNEDGSFSCRIVTTGTQSEDSVLILSGLGNSKVVVTSGAYLLNSELILKKGTITEEKEAL